jgi:hypothetical protein
MLGLKTKFKKLLLYLFYLLNYVRLKVFPSNVPQERVVSLRILKVRHVLNNNFFIVLPTST